MEEALRALFERTFGETVRSVQPVHGDGSARRLIRLGGTGRTAIGVVGPDDRENAAFLAFSRHFRKEGLRVPEIYAEDLARGLYLEEDLGDTTLFDLLTKTRTPRGPSEEAVQAYRKAVRVLPLFQLRAGKGLDYRLCYPRAGFDRRSMLWDLNYFKYYFLRLAKVPFNEAALEDDFQRLTAFLLEAPRDSFLYRDFQSRNIMVRDGEPWFIDYQGGRRGALQYDIASILFDAKADLPFPLRDALLREYLQAVREIAAVDEPAFMRFYPGFVYIRIFQALGAYGLRGFYEKKAHFLQSIPYAIRNLEVLLGTAELPVKLPALTGVVRALVGSSRLRQIGQASLQLTVRVQSFSYKSGVPTDERGHGGGYVFDCRALPNPGREERFSKLTGRDPEVVRFLSGSPEVRRFLEHVDGLVDQAVENYRTRNFTDLLVGFGCTGGLHRSVYCAETLARRLRERHGVLVELRHAVLEGPGG